MESTFVRCNELVKKINELSLGKYSIEVIKDEKGIFHLIASDQQTGELIELVKNIPFTSYDRFLS